MYPIQFLYRSAQLHAERVAVEHNGVSLTYLELVAQCDALAAAFQALSGKARPCVAVLGPNTLELLLAVTAVHASGGILVPLNSRNARLEMDAQIAAAKPDLIVTDPAYLDAFAMSATGSERVVLAGDATGAAHPTVASLVSAHSGQKPRWNVTSCGEVNAIKFTGGSSGVPKGVMQSFRCINTLIANMLLTFRFNADEVYACAAPITHGAGTFVLPVLAVGGRIVMVSDPRPEPLAAVMESRSVTAIWVPPTLLYRMTEEQLARPRPLRLRHLIFGGAPAAPEKVREARMAFGEVLEAVYGQTEAPSILTALTAAEMADPRNENTVGRACALSGLAIMDPQGKLLPAGETGEIVASGDLLMNAYLDMPDETARTLVNGWLHTGDLGSIDERGYLTIRDRLRDVVISGGFNIYPSDVEAMLCKHPAVRECVVFGVADPHWGERLEAAVELRAGMSVQAAEIASFAREMLGSVKAPKTVHVVNDLPRSPVGKVLRREARTLFSSPVGDTH